MPNLTFYISPKDEEKIVLIFFLDLRRENFSVEQTICTSKQKHWGSTFQPSNNIIHNCDLQGLSVAYQIQVITCVQLCEVLNELVKDFVATVSFPVLRYVTCHVTCHVTISGGLDVLWHLGESFTVV